MKSKKSSVGLKTLLRVHCYRLAGVVTIDEVPLAQQIPDIRERHVVRSSRNLFR